MKTKGLPNGMGITITLTNDDGTKELPCDRDQIDHIAECVVAIEAIGGEPGTVGELARLFPIVAARSRSKFGGVLLKQIDALLDKIPEPKP